MSTSHQSPLVVTWRNAVRDSNMIPNRKFVLLTLSTYMNGNGWCHPPLTTLAEKTGLNRRTIIRHMNAAEDEGWIARKPGGRNLHAGKNKATEYVAKSPVTAEKSPVTAEPADTDAQTPIYAQNGQSPVTMNVTPIEDLNLNLSQVLGVTPQTGDTRTDDLVAEVERDEQTRSQERAPEEEAQPASTSNRSSLDAESSQPISFDASSSDHEKAAPPPGGLESWGKDWRKALRKVPA